jgi:predicted aspartyl protease
MNANLADDTTVRTDVHVATIVWDGKEVDVVVLALGRRPLLGTALLAGKELVSQFIDSGLVTVDDV